MIFETGIYICVRPNPLSTPVTREFHANEAFHEDLSTTPLKN